MRRWLALFLLPTAAAVAADETVTTRQDQRSLVLTVYNKELALVKDTR